jgi:hypothetical protein
MKFSADDFKRIYAEMPDEELRSLVRAELTEVARQCYDDETAALWDRRCDTGTNSSTRTAILKLGGAWLREMPAPA